MRLCPKNFLDRGKIKKVIPKKQIPPIIIFTTLGLWSQMEKDVNGFKVESKPIKILGVWFAHDKKLMQDLNVGGKLEKIKTSLNRWQARGLTLYGRILVLKALGLSQCTYAMINTVIPDSFLDKVNAYVFEFIWGGKNRSRIRRNVMIQDYINGGYKAPDIYSMHSALKCNWVSRLIKSNEDAKWAKLMMMNLDTVGGLTYLLSCNYDVKHLPAKLDAFLEQTLKAYSEVRTQKVSTRREIENQIINNNKRIILGNKSVYVPQLRERNMDKIGNWFAQNGEPVRYHMIRNVYGINISWLQYAQILSAIPREWRKKIKQEARAETNPAQAHPTFLQTREAKEVLIRGKYTKPAALTAWARSFPNASQDDEFWPNNFLLARKTAKETKLQVFQFKVLHRIIATRSFLHKAKLSDSPNCLNCDQVKESIEHLLLECPKVQAIWTHLLAKFNATEDMNLTLDPQNCLFGIKSSKKEIRKWNYIALILRFFIYKCRLNSQTPTKMLFTRF